jgi:hypothetical protein
VGPQPHHLVVIRPNNPLSAESQRQYYHHYHTCVAYTQPTMMQETGMNSSGLGSSSNKKRGPDDNSGFKLATVCGHASLTEGEFKRRRYSELEVQPLLALSAMCGYWLYKIHVFGDLYQHKTEESPAVVMGTLLDMVSNERYEASSLKVYLTRTLKEMIPILQETQYRLSAIDGALNAMQNTPSSLEVQIEASKILQHLVKPTGETLRNSPQAVNVLVSALQNHPDDVHLQCLLLDLVRRMKPNHSDMTSEAIVVIMETMTHHLDNACIQQIGHSITAWLAEDDMCRPILIESGGLDSFPEAMKRHPTDVFIQCNAAAALCWLIHSDGNNNLLLFQARHAATILASMQAHYDHASVFGNCVCILSGLVDLPESADIVRAVRIGMQAHIGSAKVQECCLRWIRFRDPALCEDEMVQCLPVIVEAMQKHANKAHLQAHACEALSSLLDVSTVIRDCLLEIGAVDVVLQALSEHRQDVRTNCWATWVLSGLLPGGGTPVESVVAFGGGIQAIETVWQWFQTEQQTGEVNNDTELSRVLDNAIIAL